ncbi:hypothetical protein AB0L75_40310 [Streptomyces sp. NPDC052101]|uniref:hypothetical protein n=1 Tax=Streptomyces sp. NPDC052101 TaxID=3155763 RepID=UPI0034281F6D
MSTGDENEWTGNPLLKQWLSERQDAFELWAAQAGGSWDFTMESVDRLEALIRSLFSSSGEIEAAQDTAFVQGAHWYLGEVFARAHGMEWQQRPGGDPEDLPFVIQAGGTGGIGADDEGEEEELAVLCPADEIEALFLRDDDNHLRDALEGWF